LLTSQHEHEPALKHIREQGYAIDDEEHFRGVRGVAVPLFHEEDNVVVSLGITGLRDRYPSNYTGSLLDILRYAKSEIEVRSRYYEYSTIHKWKSLLFSYMIFWLYKIQFHSYN